MEAAAITGITKGASIVGGTTITLGLTATFEDKLGTLAVNSTSGVTWRVTGPASIAGDALTVASTSASKTVTVEGIYYSQIFDVFSDYETGKVVFWAVPDSSTAAPPPLAPIFGAPPVGYTLVSVTLTNPFSQVLGVDEVSHAVPGSGTSGLGDTVVYDPFADALDNGAFAIDPNSSITATIGLLFPSGNFSDQDLSLLVTGTLADGTLVTTSLLHADLLAGTTSLIGTFQPVPEPSTLFLLGSSLGLLGMARRQRAKGP